MPNEYPPHSVGLTTPIAERLYHHTAAALPVIAVGTLPAEPPRNAAELFLTVPDVCAVMRTAGIEEKFITGEASDYEKFRAFCRIVPDLAGHPLFLSAHLLLRRLLNCPLMLNEENCGAIWQIAADRLALLTDCTPLLKRLQIGCLFTLHPAVGTQARPLFMPSTDDVDDTLPGAAGCTAARHILPRLSAFVKPDPYHADLARKRLTEGQPLDDNAAACLAAQQLRILGREYRRRGWTLQLVVPQGCNPAALDALLAYLSANDALPQTMLCLSEPIVPLTVHTKAAFSPNPLYTLTQLSQALQTFAAKFPLGRLCGIADAADSLLALAQHDLFRRALCDALGRMVQDGTAPADEDILAVIVHAVCFGNAARFFGIG